MISKKDVVVAALATFCLTSTLFMMLPTRSETPVGTYDPWIDLNEDGHINILDSIRMGLHYLTSGDSTKNVDVVEFHNATWDPFSKEVPLLVYYPLQIAPNTSITLNLGTVWATGYSRMSVYIKLSNISMIAETSLVDFNLCGNETYYCGIGPGFRADSLVSWYNWTTDREFGMSWPWTSMYDMKAPAYLIMLEARYEVHYPLQPPASCLLSLELYFRNE